MGYVTLSVIIGVVIAILWVYQFTQLMLLSDADFPGKNDKALWVATFLLACLLAPFAFLSWKTAYKMMREEERSTDGGGPN